MKLLTKLAGMVTILLAITFFVAGFGMVSIANVGENLRGIANSDVPLLNSITRITMNQLEQSVWFERATMALEKDDLYAYEKAEEELVNSGYQAKNEFDVSMQLLKTTMDEISNDSDAAKYSDVAERLNEISGEYYDLNDSTEEILLHMKNGTISLTDIDMSLVKDQVQALSEKLQGLTAEISGSTQAMAVITKQQEADATRMMTIISLLAFLMAIGLGLWIIRSVRNQLGADPSVLLQVSESLSSGMLDIKHDGVDIGVYGSINKTLEKLREIIKGIKSGAHEVSIAAEQVSQGNANLSQRTQEQASSLEEVASSMEQMTGTTSQNASNAQLTNKLAQDASKLAENGVQVVRNAVQAMNEIDSSSKKIADIIKVIDEIAFQTNLLALNAAVEAARAGEQGRGFAVVASEVRNLAGRSATAAKEIKALIEDSVSKVESGSALVNESGKSLEDIVSSVKKASVMATEIAEASKEQSEGIEQVNKAILQMDEMTQQNASLVEQAAAASEAMGAQAEELSALVSYFDLGYQEDTISYTDVKQIAGDSEIDKEDAGPVPALDLKPERSTKPSSSIEDEEWKEF
ncbi:MAG: methyl-accepting chemotaxis protein [Gammaproteobacteria bacterium]|nr:methyl-accepting chemotaxis protein [Gammaproteobacteria bacterium]